MTVLTVLPLVPKADKQALWQEFLDAVTEGQGVPADWKFEDLLRLADVDGVRPRFLTKLIIVATQTEQYETGRLSPDQRDRLLGDYAERLARKRRITDAFQVVRAIPTDQGRLAAIELVLEGVNRWLVFAVLQLPEPPRARWQMFARLLWAGLLRIGPGGRRRLRKRLYNWAMALDGEHRTGMLWNLLPYLPADLAQQARDALRKALAEADTSDTQNRRQIITGLANLAEISPAPDHEILLSRAFELATIGDEDERRALAAEIHWLSRRREPQLPDRRALLESLDQFAKNGTEPTLDFSRLPAELVALAWESFWAQAPRHFGQFGVLAGRMAELGLINVTYDRLASFIASLSPEALAALLECLPQELVTTRLVSYLIERWAKVGDGAKAEEDFAKDLRAIERMARQFPDDIIRAIIEWDRSARPKRRWPGYFTDDIAACLAPLYAQAGHLDEALVMARAMTAHHEKARALAGIARYLPDPHRMATASEALVLARSTGSERMWPEAQRQFGEALMKLFGATRIDDIVDDSPDARALAIIASLLPPQEAVTVWKEAITAMSGTEILDFVNAMPDHIARDAITVIARRSADDHSGQQTPITRAIFARIAESSLTTQFEQLIDFTTQAATQGRPVLLRQLRVIAPLLKELGGDAALSGLQRAIYRVATWWP